MAATEQTSSTPALSPLEPAPRLDRRGLLASGGALLAGAAAASLPLEVATAAPAAAAATAPRGLLTIGFLPDDSSRVVAAQRVRSVSLGSPVQVVLYGIAGTIPTTLAVLAHFPDGEGGWHSFAAASIDATPGSASVPVSFRMPVEAGGLNFSLVAGTGDQAVAYPFRLGSGGAAPLADGTYFIAAGEPRTVARLDWSSYQFDRGAPSAGLSQSVLRGGRRGRVTTAFPHVVLSIGPASAE